MVATVGDPETKTNLVIPQVDGAYYDSDLEDEDENDSNNDYSACDDGSIKQVKDQFGIRFLLTNARSLKPKIDSLVDAFTSLDLHFASVTETWYKGGSRMNDDIVELEGRSGIRVLHRSRDGRSARAGGGVALAFNTGSCNFKRRQLKHIGKEFEVLCAVGKVGKVERTIVIFVVYIPPTMRTPELERMKELLAVELIAIKTAYNNPIVVVNGDMNHRDLGGAIQEVEDLQLVETGPTRGNSTIDLIYLNTHTAVSEILTLPPLQSVTGNNSDHRCIFISLSLPPERNYRWITQWRRMRDERRENAFAQQLANWDWTRLAAAGSVDEMAGVLEKVIADLTDQCFPLVRVRKRSNEAPWITRSIRRLWKKKIRVYKNEGRSQLWWDTDRKLQEKIEESRLGFVHTLLEEGNSGKSFYAAKKNCPPLANPRNGP